MLQRTLHLYQRAYQGLSPSVWLLATVMLINRCGTMVLPFMTLYLTQHLHYTVTEAGIIMAVFGAGAFIGTFLGGRLTDRFGFYYLQLFSLMFGGFALIGLQFVTNFYLLCGCIFTFTLFGDSFRPANQAAIAHYSDPDNRTRAFSLNRLAINLGWAVGGALGGWLASINYSLLFWVDGLTCLLASIVLWIYLPVPSSTQEHRSTSSSGTLPTTITPQSPYRDRLFIGFVVFAAVYLMVFMQLFTIVPLFFKERLGITVQLIGRLMALNGVIIVLFEMALVYSLEQRKHPKTTLIVTGSILTALAYLSLALPTGAFLSGLHVALIFILFATLGEMLSIPFLQSFTVERSNPATRGQYLALYGMGASFAQTTAPIFGSFMVAQAGFSVHWPVAASIILVSTCGFLWLGNELKHTENQQLLIEQSSD
ncbi:MDR family MFS transporter [Spirosoma gilvum]